MALATPVLDLGKSARRSPPSTPVLTLVAGGPRIPAHADRFAAAAAAQRLLARIERPGAERATLVAHVDRGAAVKQVQRWLFACTEAPRLCGVPEGELARICARVVAGAGVKVEAVGDELVLVALDDAGLGWLVQMPAAERLRLGELPVVLGVVKGAPQGTPIDPCEGGVWEAAFDHRGALPSGFLSPCAPVPVPPPFFEENPAGGQPYGFEAIHMSLIPIGPHQGKVLVWNHVYYAGGPLGQKRVLRWSIVDPVAKTFLNYETCMPEGLGDLFCAGHAWLPDGTLLVVGGTEYHGDLIQPWNPPPPPSPPPGNGFTGARLAYLFDPLLDPVLGQDPWIRLPDLDERRWYPSALVLGVSPNDGDTYALVMGGSDNGTGVSSYQSFNTKTRIWQPNPFATPPNLNTFPGPAGSYDFQLHDYTRVHLLSNGLVVTSGMRRGSSLLQHYPLPPLPPFWLPNDSTWLMANDRQYGTSVLFPLSIPTGLWDHVVTFGGYTGMGIAPPILKSDEVSIASSTGPSKYWAPFTTAGLTNRRWFLNSVLLPDCTILAVGGEQVSTTFGCAMTPALAAEQYRGGAWRLLNATTINRDYHSSALLLRDGKVLTASGESRRYAPATTCPRPQGAPKLAIDADYQLFSPPYLHCGNPRPVITSGAPPGSALAWGRGTQQLVTHDPLPPGSEVVKVVLVRVGSVTHHCDPNQRAVSLAFSYIAESSPPQLVVTVPTSSNLLPQGPYMLFLVTGQSTPSVAAWVMVQ